MMFLLSKLAAASVWGVVLLLIIKVCHQRFPIEVRPFLWRLTWLKLLCTLLPISPLIVPLLLNQTTSVKATPANPSVPVSEDARIEVDRTEQSTSSDEPIVESRSSFQPSPELSNSTLRNQKRDASQSDSERAEVSLLDFSVNQFSFVILVLWSLGIAFQLRGLTLSFFQLRRILQASSSNFPEETWVLQLAREAGLKVAPRILVSDTNDPFLCGILSPTVVVSRQLLSDRAALKMTLAHEFSHLKRRDLIWDLLGLVAQILFWFLPMVHMARRAEKSAVEAACDAQTIRHFAFRPHDYGVLLLQVASKPQNVMPLALGISDGFEELKSRLQLLKRQKTTRWGLILSITALGLCALTVLAPIRLVTAAPTEVKSKSSKTKLPNFWGQRQAPDPSAIFQGNVSDETESPIAGAKIYVMREMTSGNSPVYQTSTDGGGNFSINARAAKLDARFSYDIWAEAPERGVGLVKYRPTKGTQNGNIILDFTAFFRPSFYYNGKWISGVKVQVRRVGTTWGSWYSVPKPILERLKATTDANGEVRFRLPKGIFVQLDHKDSRFAPLFFAANNSGSEPPVVTLEKPSSVSGFIRFPDGKPVEDVTVSARYITRGEQRGFPYPIDYSRKTVKTDARGFYRISNLRSGKYRIKAAIGKNWRTVKDAKYVTRTAQPVLIAGEEKREDFNLREGLVLTGGVVSQSSGEVIAGQYMRVVDSQGDTHYAISKSSGRFEFYLMPGKGQLFAHGNMVSPPKGFALPVKNVWNFDLKEGYSTGVVIQLPDAPGTKSTIKGVVLGANGKPVEGVRVCFYSTDKSKDPRINYIGPRTKSDGEFLLAGRQIGTSANVWASRGTEVVSAKVEAKLGDKIVLRVNS